MERLCALAADPNLTEDAALSLLEQRDLSGEAIAVLVRNPVMKSRRVLRAVVAHPRTPRHISLPRARHMYTFELMQLALSPTVAADVRQAGEEVIVNRLGTITAGERLTLAKRASTRVVAALLLDPDKRVMQAALASGRITEAWVIRALQSSRASVDLVHAVCRHSRWSLRRDIQVALLRNPHTPLPRAVCLATGLPTGLLADLLDHVSNELRGELEKEIQRREDGKARKKP